ncbi:MAG: peptide chain release factor 1 [Myxococcales bacterium]|nr:peptide chain release factor 1 [Myxococcales bacterium]MDH3482770.1 peptide chain release factor 1 [Myxococcales bacterium]
MLPEDKLESLTARYREIEELLCQPNVASDANRYTQLNKERADLQKVVEVWTRYCEVVADIAGHKEALSDPDLRQLAEEEIPGLEKEREQLEASINVLLLPKDPNDERNTILEIRSGTGGEEAALFAADLFRMYSRYAETQGWKVEVSSISEASAGGIKEVIAEVSGDNVYSKLRFEGGVHRVQRIPTTESQGRIHTSTATVAVMPEVDDIDEVKIDPNDLEISTTAAGGPGGQHVNRTMSAVQIKHLPSGIMVRSEQQRSQHQNKAKAMQILSAKLLDLEREAQASAISSERRSMVGTGERSEKIRTYNFPQNRVTDHRIQLTLHNLDRMMNGDVGEMLIALRSHHQAELMKQQAES